MRVNVYTRQDSLMPTGDDTDDCQANVDLKECFPGPENGDEYLLAHMELGQIGRYWGGGGAAPLFLMMRAPDCQHNEMVSNDSPSHAWKCATCGYVYK